MQNYYYYTKKTLLLKQEIIKIMDFRQKQKQIESNLKNQFKQSVKSKIPQLKSKLTKNAQLENNKTYTIKPSYIDLQQKLYQQMKQNLHMIVNKSSFMALRKQIKSQNFKTTEQPQKSKLSSINPKQVFHNIHNAVAKQEGETYAVKITGGKQNENSLTQLWALVVDQLHSNSVYIHHIESNLAIRIINEKVVLAPKEKTKDFMFTIKIKTGVKSLYEHSISILSALNGKALALKGILCLNEPNPKDECQQFYLRKIGLYQPIKLKDTFILSNPKDKGLYCLSATRDKQQILYQKMDYSLEQRWKFSPSIVSRDDKVIVMGRGKQIDMINEQDIKIGQSRNTLNQRKSKLEELNPYQINLVTKAAKNLIEEYDNDCCEIINLKLDKSLVLRDFKGTQRLVFVSKSQRREWKVQCDGYSMKIKHFQKEEYLGLDNGLVTLSKEPHYWEVVQSYQNKLQKSSQIVDFKSQKFNSSPHSFVKQ